MQSSLRPLLDVKRVNAMLKLKTWRDALPTRVLGTAIVRLARPFTSVWTGAMNTGSVSRKEFVPGIWTFNALAPISRTDGALGKAFVTEKVRTWKLACVTWLPVRTGPQLLP